MANKNGGSPQSKSTDDAPEVLELVLETKEVKYWEPFINIDGHQLIDASDEDFHDLQEDLKKRYENAESEKIFSEIREVQRLLRGKPKKRDKDERPILVPLSRDNPDVKVPQYEDFDIEESRPRNRILWAIEDALKGKEPEDVKKITIRFTLKADIKQPKYSDAVLLAKIIGWGTEKVRGIGDHWPDFRNKFVPIEWPGDQKASEQGCLLTEAQRVIKEIK